MDRIKIAYISTSGSDVFPLISALKELKVERGDVAEVCLRSKEDLSDPDGLEEFIHRAEESDLVIVSLHGGKKILECFDQVVERICTEQGQTFRLRHLSAGCRADRSVYRRPRRLLCNSQVPLIWRKR
jgi:hypothetical protein